MPTKKSKPTKTELVTKISSTTKTKIAAGVLIFFGFGVILYGSGFMPGFGNFKKSKRPAQQMLIVANIDQEVAHSFFQTLKNNPNSSITPSLTVLPNECKKNFNVGVMLEEWYQQHRDNQANLTNSQMRILSNFAKIAACFTTNELARLENTIWNTYQTERSIYLANKNRNKLTFLSGEFIRINAQALLLLWDSDKHLGTKGLGYKLTSNTKLLDAIKNNGWTSKEIYLYDRTKGDLIGLPVCNESEIDCIDVEIFITSINKPAAIGVGDCSFVNMLFHGKNSIGNIEMYTCPTNRLCGNSPEPNLSQLNKLEMKWGQLTDGTLNNLRESNVNFCSGRQQYRNPNMQGGVSNFLIQNGCQNRNILSNIRNSSNNITNTMACHGLSNDPIADLGGQRLLTAKAPLNGVIGCDPRLMDTPEQEDTTQKTETEEERKKREQAEEEERKKKEETQTSKDINNTTNLKTEVPLIGQVDLVEVAAKVVKKVTTKVAGDINTGPTYDETGIEKNEVPNFLGKRVPIFQPKMFKLNIGNNNYIKVGGDKTGIMIAFGGSNYCPPDSGNCADACTAQSAQINESPFCTFGDYQDPVIGNEGPGPIDPISTPRPDQYNQQSCTLSSSAKNSVCDTVMCPNNAQQGIDATNCCGANIGQDQENLREQAGAPNQNDCSIIQCNEGQSCQNGFCVNMN